MMLTSPDVLRASIESHNDAFESLLSLIPPKHYLVKEDDVDTVVRLCIENTPRVRPNLWITRSLASTRNTARIEEHPSRQSRRRPKRRDAKRYVLFCQEQYFSPLT